MPRPTHFLAIPLCTPSSLSQLRATLPTLYRSVLETPLQASPAEHPPPLGKPSSSYPAASSSSSPSTSRADGRSERQAREELSAGDEGTVPEGALRPLGTLHLTLGVMALDGEGLDAARALLREIDFGSILSSLRSPAGHRPSSEGDRDGEERRRRPEGFGIALKGLESMTPRSADRSTILYAKVAEELEGMLLGFCEMARRAFVDRGLIIEENGRSSRPLLLHATLVNLVYIQGRGRRNKPRHDPGRRREVRAGRQEGSTLGGGEAFQKQPERMEGKGKVTFDARGLLEMYKDTVWARDIPVDKLVIYKMGAKKVHGEEGEAYEAVAEVAVTG
ncbi:kinase A anchor protein [Bisporella sp. PMI_857]|nr:kinase A anchor protein [Bisporella sp. PMI_857]